LASPFIPDDNRRFFVSKTNWEPATKN